MKRVLFFLVLFFFSEVYAQSISLQSIEANSVIISYNISEQARLFIYENDTIYYEDFSVMTNTANSYIYNKFLWKVPFSYLKTPGAKMQHIAYSGEGLKMDRNSKFQTPHMDISKTNNNGVYSYSLRVELEKLSGSKPMYIKNNLGEDVHTPTNTSFYVDSTRTLPDFHLIFFSDATSSAAREHLLKKVIITIPQEYCNKQTIDLTATNNTHTINNLSPNTKYVIALGTDTLSFTTLKEKTLDSINNITTNSANIYFSDNNTSNKKVKVINKGNNYKFADDLFISEFAYYTPNYNAIELYNGTGGDVCLKDYKLILYATEPFEKTFTYRDTIKHNSTLVIYNEFDIPSEISNAGEFHYVTPLFYDHKPIVLLHNNDTVDVFGNVCETSLPSTIGWTCTDNNEITLNTARYDLRRNSSVNCGIKHNPNNGFPTLCSEWTGSNSTNETNFRNFGLHTMDNVISKENIANINFGTEITQANISLADGFYQVNNLEENSYYVAYITSEDESIIYDYKGFLTKGSTQRTASGIWSDDNWTAGEPTFNSVVEIPSNMEVTITSGTTAKADTLIIKNGASFKNNGISNIKNFEIEKTFIGYNNDYSTTAWYLMGVPIVANSDNQSLIAQAFNTREDNDNIDLYFWKEDYTENNMQGMWANYRAYNSTEPFFVQTKGYLVAYANDTTDKFRGVINDKHSYTLLSNATLSGDNSNFGWHLVANPYTFPITLSQLTRNNIAVPNILNTNTGNYTPLTSEEITIAPFEGFFVQVTNANNSLLVEKNGLTNNSPRLKFDDLEGRLLTFSLSDGVAEDKFSMAFDNEASFGLDWQTDSRKLKGFGSASEIFATFNNENFALNHIPFSQEDTLVIDLRCLIKHMGNYNITFNEANISPYDNVLLIDRLTREELVDLSLSPSYSFVADENMPEDKFLLKFTRTFSCDNSLLASNFINISQNNNTLQAYSNEVIRLLTLYSADGKQIAQTSDNKITIQQKGVFFLTIKTDTNQKTFKVIIL